MAFLKTHKCASSSIQNVLLRFAMKNELNVVLPLTGNYAGKFAPFSNAVLYGTPWEQAKLPYHVHCLHGIWNYTGVRAVLDRADGGADPPFVFSIVRDPVEQFASLWDYAKLGWHYNATLEEYALAPKRGKFVDRRALSNLGHNQMLFDFGLGRRYLDDEEAIAAKIEDIDRTFDLVLVAERFEESMLLLRDALCWTFEDVSYLKLNMRQEKKKSRLSGAARASLRKWLRGDYELYDHFVAKFDSEVARFGAGRMDRELRTLAAANANIREKCVSRVVDNSKLPETYRSWGDGLVGYDVNLDSDPFCKYYGIAELAFIDETRQRQADRARAKLAEEGKVLEAAYDPTKFQPRKLVKNGRPDVEKLRQIFGEGRG